MVRGATKKEKEIFSGKAPLVFSQRSMLSIAAPVSNGNAESIRDLRKSSDCAERGE